MDFRAMLLNTDPTTPSFEYQGVTYQFNQREVEQLLHELQSVAIEWRTPRSTKSCSCALPFEQHTKKVDIHLIYVYSHPIYANHHKCFVLFY